MAIDNTRRLRPDWISKSLAGLIGGFVIALGLAGLFAWVGPGGLDAPNKVQFNMWIITPLWMLILSLVFLFRTGWRAWLWLGGAALLVQGLLWWVKNGGIGG